MRDIAMAVAQRSKALLLLLLVKMLDIPETKMKRPPIAGMMKVWMRLFDRMSWPRKKSKSLRFGYFKNISEVFENMDRTSVKDQQKW